MVLLIFVLLVGAAALTGAQFEPGAWYAQLVKPVWTPPNWLFAPVWSVLYLAIAVAGWLVWRAARGFPAALQIWGMQLALNMLWSWLFFGLHHPRLALLDIVLLLLSILAFIAAARRYSVIASWLFAPYAAWVAFATALNAAIAQLN
jgi:benzodiazapine receptor